MRKILYIAVALLALVSCANRGVGPQGGPKDSIPPLPLHAEPESGTLNFKGKRIEVTFNEYIQLNNVSSNLLMSPPQQNQPDVKARGKKLLVQFKDSLLDSTTYTIDFGMPYATTARTYRFTASRSISLRVRRSTRWRPMGGCMML